MIKYLLDLLGVTIFALSLVYAESKVLRKPTKSKPFFLIINTIILANALLINKSFMDNLIIPIISFLILIIGFKVIYKEVLSKTIVSAFFTLILSCIAEILWGIIAMFVFHLQIATFQDKLYGILVINTAIGIIVTILAWTIRKFIIKELTIVETKGNIAVYIFLLLIIFSLSFLIFKHLNEGVYDAMVLADYLILFLFCAGIVLIIREHGERTKLSKEYDLLQEYVETTEGILENYRKANHENKNQLVALHSMIESNDNNVLEYINSLLHEKMPKDVEVINNLASIPLGGLKGLMYHKISKMKETGLDVKISIISTKKKDVKIPIETTKDLFKIMGVYLDNACEAAIESSERRVDVEGYFTDEELSFAITNSCLILPDIEKMDNAGYTTKEKGHGYGLSLVRDILNGSDTLSQRREIEGNQYTQYLDVKTK